MSYARRARRRASRRAGRAGGRAVGGLARLAARQLNHDRRVRYADIAFRIRCSWWARWVVPAYLATFVHGVSAGHSSAAWLLTFAIIGGVIFNRRLRTRAVHGMNMRPQARKARRGWKYWAESRDSYKMHVTASHLYTLFTGERSHPPRIKHFDTENDEKTFVIVAESPPGLTEEKWARNAAVIASYMNMPVPSYELRRDANEVVLRFTGNGGPQHIAQFTEEVPEKLPNLKALPVARFSDGSVARLPFGGGHTLVIGATGSGKGSVFWSILRTLAPGIRDGFVQVWAVDPKGGVELTPGRALFHRFQVGIDGDQQAELVAFLEELVATMKSRLARMQATGARLHKITRREPLIVLLFDEFLMLQYGMDGVPRKNATMLLKSLLSQGRAAQVVVVGAAQMGQKTEIGSIRELFPYRICLRTSEPNQVNLVLGEGALARGAEAHKIGLNAQGTGYFMEAGGGPVMVRFPWSSDAAVEKMARSYAPDPALTTGGAATPGTTPRAVGGGGTAPQDVLREDVAAAAPGPGRAAGGSGRGELWDKIEAELDRLEAAHVEPVPSVVAKHLDCSAQYVRKVLKARREAADGETGGETGGETHPETGSPGRNEVPNGDPSSAVKSSQAETIQVLDQLWSLPAYGEATWDDAWRDRDGSGGAQDGAA